MPKVLVTGGCGYIGSHAIVDLLEKGHEVVSIDSYINSDPSPLLGIEKITGLKVKNYPYDLCELVKTRAVFENHPDIDSVIHFAALKSVKESVDHPYLYFKNNINSLINLLDCCHEFGVKNFIFSSSCTVYGNPDQLPVSELSPLKKAESPYGRTKQISEDLIIEASQNSSLKSILLRYFNPAGAHESNELGESPVNQALNLIPVITETAIGKRDTMNVFGNDYPTRDGTNIRDYIHVVDLAIAHTLALEYVSSSGMDKQVDIFNLGIGKGVSVLEAIQAFEKVSQLKLNYKIGPRRPGDVVAIYSDYNKACEKLGWKPSKNIEDIMRTAWKWEQKRTKSAS